MKKKDLILRIADDLDVTQKRAEEIYEAIFSEIINNLSKGSDIKLSGFGSLQIINRKTKLGRNPRTGERLEIPQHPSVKFRMGKNLTKKLQQC